MGHDFDDGQLFDDGFEAAAEFGRRNRGGHLQGKNLPPWLALSTGKTIGTSVDLVDNAGGANINTNIDMLEVNSDNGNALQLSVIFAPPMTNQGVTNGGFINSVDSPATAIYTFGNPVGIVEWGLGSSRNMAEVDILNGFAMNLGGCSFVRLRARIETISVARTAMTYRFSAAVNPGRVKNTGASRTIEIGDMAINTQSSIIPIPRFARQVSVSGINVAALPGAVFVGSVRFWHGRNGVGGVGPIGEYTFAGNAPNSVWLPIPNGAYFCTVVNQLAEPNNIGIMFDLAI